MKLYLTDAPGDVIDVSVRAWIRYAVVAVPLGTIASWLIDAGAWLNERSRRALPDVLQPSSAWLRARRLQLLATLLEDERCRPGAGGNRGDRARR